MTKLYFLLFFLFLGMSAYGQQTPQYSLYMLNRFAYNPAYAGMDNSLSITGSYRKQWVDIPGSPSTYNVSAHLPVYLTNGGFGILLESETLGVNDDTYIGGAYTYQMDLGRRAVLSIGLGGGLHQRSVDGSRLRTQTGDYSVEQQVITHNDPILPTTRVSGSTPTFSAGIYLQTENLEIGFSSLRLAEQTIEFDEFSTQFSRHYLLSATYGYDLTRKLRLEPSLLLKSNGTQHQTDVSLLAYYNESFLLGGSYRGYTARSQDAVVLIAGFNLSEQIRVAYGYDLTLSALNTVGSGSHEVTLNYNFGRPIGQGRPPKVIYNPRNL